MKWLIVVLILAVVLIAGCSGIPGTPICSPNWVLGYGEDDITCKSQCYTTNKVTSHKIEITANPPLCTCYWNGQAAGIERNATSENCDQICQQNFARPFNPPVTSQMVEQPSTTKCYCDVNNCSP